MVASWPSVITTLCKTHYAEKNMEKHILKRYFSHIRHKNKTYRHNARFLRSISPFFSTFPSVLRFSREMLRAYSAVKLCSWIPLEIKTYLVAYFLTNSEDLKTYFPSANLICCTLLSSCFHAISNCKHVSFITFYKLSGSITEALQGFLQ